MSTEQALVTGGAGLIGSHTPELLSRALVLAYTHLKVVGAEHGTSVTEILAAIARFTDRNVPIEMRARGVGDPPVLYADRSFAAEKLGFQAVYSDLETISRSAASSFGLDLRDEKAAHRHAR